MDKLDWYYIYSQRYYSFDFYLKDAIPNETFILKGIFIDQSVFDEHLYKHEGEHFFSRITVKVETVLRLIQEKRAAGVCQPFFFTDVDIVVKSSAASDIYAYSQKKDLDMIFQQEHVSGTLVNPGVMLVWPTEASENFWNKVLESMKMYGRMEMDVINDLLKTNIIHSERFDTAHVTSPITLRADTLETFSIYHLLSGASDRYSDMSEKLVQINILVKDMLKYHERTMERYGMIFT